MMNFRVVTGCETRTLARHAVWYVERRTDDGHLGIVGLVYEKRTDAEAVSKKLNEEEAKFLA